MQFPRPSRHRTVTLTATAALLGAAVLSGCSGVVVYTSGSLIIVATSSGGSGNTISSGSTSSSGSSSGAAPPYQPPRAVMQAQSANSAVAPAIVAADSDFGLALFQDLLSESLSQQPNANVSIAPVGIAMALQLAYNGAAGDTQQAMSQSLRLGRMTSSQLNSDNAALQASLLDRDPQVQITVANSIWTHLADNPIAPSFIQTDETYYGAVLGDLSGAPNDINGWVASETHGLITQIAPDIDYRSAQAVIANAAYFKGVWTDAFDASQTLAAPFTRNDGTQIPVMLMHQTVSHPFFQGPNYQVIQLPYGQGHFSMLILLPASGTDLGSFAVALTPDSLAAILLQLQSTGVQLALPRFTAGYSGSLVDTLNGLGMLRTLCPDGSFPALANSCISDVDHGTLVEVDEGATVAAGAMMNPVPAMVVPESIPRSADHPFLYLIRDDDNGELLFIGALMDPSSPV
jgi:serpin B